MKKWTISGVSNGIESEVRMTTDDIVSAFLAENGIYDDNPIIEFIDIALLKRALISEQAADMPPPAMVVNAPNPGKQVAGKVVAPPPEITFDWPESGKFVPFHSGAWVNEQVLNVTITWQKNDAAEVRGTVRDENMITSAVADNIREFIRQIAPVYHCTNQKGIEAVRDGIMLVGPKKGDLRTKASNISAINKFVVKEINKYPDRQSVDPTTITFSISFQPSNIVKEHFNQIEHQKKLQEIERANELKPRGGSRNPGRSNQDSFDKF
jgi:hypothetical protein